MALLWTDHGSDAEPAPILVSALPRRRAARLTWYLRDLEIVGGPGLRGLTALALEAAVAASPTGVEVSWPELVRLVLDAGDVHDLVATGHLGPCDVAVDVAAGTYPGCAAVVELVDSGPLRTGWDPALLPTIPERPGVRRERVPARPSALLAPDEVALLARAIGEWGGPAHASDDLARAMGFGDGHAVPSACAALSRSLRDDESLSPEDWTRVLVAAEIAFVSDVHGSGTEWQTTTGYDDAGTLRRLRSIQRRLGQVAVRP